MNHRKKEHKIIQLCKKVNEEGGCPRSSDACWFLHANTDFNGMKPQADFPQASQNKTRPLYSDMINSSPASMMIMEPSQTEKKVMEMMSMMKNQSNLMMEMLSKMNQKL